VVHPVSKAEGKFKLCKVVRQETTKKGIPVVVTHDGRTIRYPNPDIKVHDSVKLDLESGKISDFVKFDIGSLV